MAVSELAGATQGGSAIQQAAARAKVKDQAEKMMLSVDSSGVSAAPRARRREEGARGDERAQSSAWRAQSNARRAQPYRHLRLCPLPVQDGEIDLDEFIVLMGPSFEPDEE